MSVVYEDSGNSGDAVAPAGKGQVPVDLVLYRGRWRWRAVVSGQIWDLDQLLWPSDNLL